MKKIAFAAMCAVFASGAFGAGFGIYEASARGAAVGGALVGKAGDATANYFNPADIANATNIQIATGVTFINPYCDVEVEHKSQQRMNAGWFTVPTFYATIPLPFDFAFGWGNYTEYGLGTRYDTDWDLAADTQKTTMRQVTLNPNLAYKVTDWWNVSAGLRASWIQFISHKHPYAGTDLVQDTQFGTLTAADPFHIRTKLKGEDWGMGWNLGTQVKPTDRLSLGLLYRSQIKHKIKGHVSMNGGVDGTLTGTLNVPTPYGIIPMPASQALPLVGQSDQISQEMNIHGRASAKLRLPDSLTFGANYDVTDRYRVMSVITYTRWSSVKNINFKLPQGYSYSLPLHWRDTYRVGIGMEYDILDWLTARIGYTFDEDPTSKSHSTTMLPCGDRHIIGSGLGFKITENLRFDVSYSFIRMNNTHYWVHYKNYQGGDERKYVSYHNGYSHLVGASLSYSF